jgi:hypothetical protein
LSLGRFCGLFLAFWRLFCGYLLFFFGLGF